MIQDKLQSILYNAAKIAIANNNEYITVDHLLMSIFREEENKFLLDYINIKYEDVKDLLKKYIKEHVPKVEFRNDTSIFPSPALTRVINSVYSQSLSDKDERCLPVRLLINILTESEGYASNILKAYSVDSNILNKLILEINSRVKKSEKEETDVDKYESYLTDMILSAKKGLYDPLIGRKVELERGIQTLCRRNKNNIIFVGESGVGKTAIVQGLAQKIASGDIPSDLKDVNFFMMDMSGMLAGAKYRGDFEDRLKKTLEYISSFKNPIIFIDEIHTIVKAGATEGGSMDAANILKPYLLDRSIRCIGSTTYEEYKQNIEKDKALARRFQKIDVIEPSVEETIKIVSRLLPYYASHHGVNYSEKVVESAVELSNRYINEKFLPDKAIDVIDEAGSYVKLNFKRKNVLVSDIEKIISDITRMQITKSVKKENELLKELELSLGSKIFGQTEAVKKISDAIIMSKAGMNEPDKPIGSFLFVGPTGVGKTELAKSLAEILKVNFLRFDMSEYGEKHAVAKLIGAPPGYVGYEQGGILTESVRKNPHTVLLLDEIEKAHPDIYNVLLQIMDYATLSDNMGRKADFRNTILIMTSNAGAKELESVQLGFNTSQEKSSKTEKKVKEIFSPEFRNRLDAVVYFNYLDEVGMMSIVNKQIKELEKRLSKNGVKIQLSSDAAEWFIKHGFDKNMGARPLKRLINERISTKLSKMILFEKLNKECLVNIDIENNDIILECV